jgi:putative toxin-antitoxin system antitoxin component (TIGR02293 family)
MARSLGLSDGPVTVFVNAILAQTLLESIRRRLRLSVPEVAAVLHMPLRTMARRRQTGTLLPDESDRLYRNAHVSGQAVSVFGAEEYLVRHDERAKT